MNIIKRLFGGDKKYLTPDQALNIRFFGGQIVPYEDNKLTYIEEGYNGNDTIASIVDLITTTAKVAPWDTYKVVDEAAYKAYRYELSKEEPDFKAAREYRAKALELVNDPKLKSLITWPNENQTFSDLNEELWMFKLVTGDYYEYWQGMPSGGLNAGIPKSLSSLPSQYMVIKSSTTLPLTADKYYLQLGQMVEFEKELILHEYYANPNWSVFGNNLYGLSKIKALLKGLQRDNEIQKAGAVGAKNGGMRGVAFYNDQRLDPNDDTTFEQMSKQKKTFRDEMRSGTDGTGHVMWSQYGVGYTQMGFSPKDMDYTQQELTFLRKACSRYGVPSQLLNDSAAKTFNTVQEAEKALITRAVLPLLCSRRDNFNNKMNRSTIIDFDLSVYDQLQPNKDQIATWVNKMPLTNSRKLEIIGEDVPEDWTDEQRNAVLIPSGFQNMDDVIAPLAEDNSEDVNRLNQEGQMPYQNTEE